jgi:TonB-linked SusC/RagA family outer membrane protein
MRRLLLLVLCMSLMTSQLLAQDRTITGKVADEKGFPVANASVVVKGTRTGTTTANDGSFSLSVPSNARALIVSFVGLGEKEIGLTSSNTYDVSLSSITGDMTEVVITGYKTSTKRDFVGSAGTVSGEKIRTVPMASFDQALQGRVPGILVQGQSGQPGAAAAVLIRGRGSVLGSNTPLYILDGIQITAADFSTLNPADFESITVLKDASATSAYGSRGANGVIVATSRKGKAGTARFNYDVQYGYSTLPENKLVVMNSTEKLDYEIANGNPYGWTATEIDSLKKNNTDWEDVFFRTGRTAQHVVSVSGGSGKTVYFLSGSFFDQRGSVENTSLKRYTGRANIESASGDFSYGINSTFGYSDFHNTAESNTSIGAPLNAVRWLNPYENVYTNGTYTSITSGQPHALQELLENSNLRQQYKTVANVFLNYAAPFLRGLNFRTNWGADFRINETSAYADPSTASGRAQTGGKGAFARGNDRSQRFTGTTSLSYTTDFNADHTLTVALFNEIIQARTRNFGFTGYGLGGAFENESGITPGNTTNGFIPTVNGGGGENALLSYFADIRYGFKNRYFLNVAGRRDGSSRFGANKQWANFGSVGASWIISDEKFMSSLKNKIFNDLKLKASYGSAGNQEGIGNFESRELYGRAVYNGVSGLVQTQLANPELQWERKTTFNAGLEVSTMKGRLRGGVEFYNSLTTDLFLNKQLSRTTGYTSLNTNIGELQNRGVEVSLDGDIINTKNFRWSANVALTWNKNTIKKLVGDQKEIIGGLTINRVGESINSIYLIRNAGVNPDDGEPLYYDKDGKVTSTYDPANRVIVGSYEVPFFGGFGTTLNFKGLELSTFFSFVKGNEIYNNDRMNVENPTYYFDNIWRDLQYEWRAPGQKTHIIAATADFDGWTGTDHFVEKGDFLRFRNAMLSYSLPSSIINKAKLKSVRMFVQGQNIFVWHDFLGFDPEISTGSLTGAQYPPLRTVTFGLNIGL